MLFLRRITVSLVLFGCGGASKEPPPAAAADAVKVEAPTAEMPQHDAKMLATGDDEAVHTVGAQGSMSATLGGASTSFTFLPFGSNVASWSEKTGVARLALAGAPSDRGLPLLRLVIENVRIDRLQLPATFPIGGGASDEGEARQDTPRARIEYQTEPRKTWHGGPEGEAVGSVTIESYAGKRVQGKFTAKVTPKSTAFGPPIEITDGRFDIQLRLQGIEPGAEPPK